MLACSVKIVSLHVVDKIGLSFVSTFEQSFQTWLRTCPYPVRFEGHTTFDKLLAGFLMLL